MSLVSTDPPLPKKSSLEKSFSHCTSFSFWSRQKLPLSHNEQKSTQYNLIKLLTNNLKILTLSGLHARSVAGQPSLLHHCIAGDKDCLIWPKIKHPVTQKVFEVKIPDPTDYGHPMKA